MIKIIIKTSFDRDIKKFRDNELRQKIFDLILEIESLPNFTEIQNMKKLKGYKYSHRIAFIHNSVKYRICINIFENEICMERFLKRGKAYKLFFY